MLAIRVSRAYSRGMDDFKTNTEIAEGALAQAKEAVKGPSGLARALERDISPQAISQWKRVPAERVLEVERATGISRHKLRPDLYPVEGSAA